ncbi:Purine nucleoside phosphorylase [Coemansia sp. RSA 1722]|nr:Purine nucleoside phosphorylase [Coemansia sp. RSA 486]KAJ2233498.1 Purine nucleoside phosphorylase [Coemansia sp. RSA 485]KAJ2605077.1 Purine nucleoside phosphorylase [Coemansia sp. RSA 1722]KAJ2639314.1 Purine nucleoside phosphorylase [Coemansia sp. RSA 1286]
MEQALNINVKASPQATAASSDPASASLSPRPIETIPHSVYESAAKHIKTQLGSNNLPEVALLCGKGLQGVSEKLEGTITEIPYTEIPGFALSTSVKTTAGRLVFGEISGTSVVCIVGRCHFYEGYSMKQITFPIRVLSLMGVSTLIVTTAVSGIAPGLDLGDIVVVKDHISLPTLAGLNPLIGPNFEKLGPRMPSMYNAYTFSLRKLAFMAFLEDPMLQKKNIRMREAVYCYATGPSSETRAEYLALRNLGAEVVGSSTVPEVLVAHHAGLNVLCLGLVTSVAAKSAEPSAEEAARAALAGNKPMTPKPMTDPEDDDILARKGSVKKGGQRPSDLHRLIGLVLERF